MPGWEVSPAKVGHELNGMLRSAGDNKMQKAKSLIGMPVIGQNEDLSAGTLLGYVRDLVWDFQESRVLALVLSEKDSFWLVDAEIVPWHEVQGIADKFIFVRCSQSKIPMYSCHRIQKAAMENQSGATSSKEILTASTPSLHSRDGISGDGICMDGICTDGICTDGIFIDVETGRIVEWEEKSGFLTDRPANDRGLSDATHGICKQTCHAEHNAVPHPPHLQLSA
jgi:uncharacterized protein YrrD